MRISILINSIRKGLRVFVDKSSVEVFANNGKVAMSNLIFPDQTQNAVYAYVNDGAVTLSSVDLWPLNDIWPKGEENPYDILNEIIV